MLRIKCDIVVFMLVFQFHETHNIPIFQFNEVLQITPISVQTNSYENRHAVNNIYTCKAMLNMRAMTSDGNEWNISIATAINAQFYNLRF